MTALTLADLTAFDTNLSFAYKSHQLRLELRKQKGQDAAEAQAMQDDAVVARRLEEERVRLQTSSSHQRDSACFWTFYMLGLFEHLTHAHSDLKYDQIDVIMATIAAIKSPSYRSVDPISPEGVNAFVEEFAWAYKDKPHAKALPIAKAAEQAKFSVSDDFVGTFINDQQVAPTVLLALEEFYISENAAPEWSFVVKPWMTKDAVLSAVRRKGFEPKEFEGYTFLPADSIPATVASYILSQEYTTEIPVLTEQTPGLLTLSTFNLPVLPATARFGTPLTGKTSTGVKPRRR